MVRWSRQLRCGIGVATEIRRIEIIFSGNAHQREKRIPTRIGEGAPMRCAEAISVIWHTGHSEEIHSPDACASTVVRRRRPASLSIPVAWIVAISWRPRLLRTMSNPLDSGA